MSAKAPDDRQGTLCLIWHRWGPYEPPRLVDSVRGGETLAQRRVCRNCRAVDYRRVIVHN